MKTELIIFDLDDTLLDTSDVYWRARSKFANELSKYGLDSETIVKMFEEIDTLNMKHLGYSPYRYGKTMKDTYEHFISEHDLAADKDFLHQIDEWSAIVLNLMPKLIKDAEKLLTWASENYTLILITRGESFLQEKKISNSRLAKYFSRVQIVPRKNAEMFRTAMSEAGFTPDKTWVVGDSIKSDINPGIEAGAKCIFYSYQHKHYQWVQERGYAAMGPFYKAEHLLDVKNIIQSPSSFKMTASA